MRMKEYPKSKLDQHDKHLRGPEGFWYKLVHDDEGKDKLEDKHPANTFIEISLWGILIMTTLSFILDLVVNSATIMTWFHR